MPAPSDPVSRRAALVTAQLLPVVPHEQGVFLWGGLHMPLPSGRTAKPALIAYPAPSGPTDPLHIAKTASLVVEVVPDDAAQEELASLLAEYTTLPELRDVVRVGLTRRAVVVYSRGDAWARHAFTRGLAPVPGLGALLRVAALYP